MPIIFWVLIYLVFAVYAWYTSVKFMVLDHPPKDNFEWVAVAFFSLCIAILWPIFICLVVLGVFTKTLMKGKM